MLIVALVLAVIGLAALVTAVVTSNELVAWVCIAASVIGVILLIVDAIRERQNRRGAEAESAPAAVAAETTESSATAETTAYAETDEAVDATYSTFDADYPDDAPAEVPVDDEPLDGEPADDEPADDEPADEPAKEAEEEPSGESGSR
ncbi:hypothetical protein [Mycolicibacterium helvum]|uniref:Transmembrane protein n=1 Tax=Mycolicibacterium helvum TaxID=1534349 RepID=A0A7I7THE2_9MYCO|nr:hypothetical protein [Mycolicibacterium helvum]BBY67586.1 hypothetical protein MHEL_58290 [Mycolicibacterium helvum]